MLNKTLLKNWLLTKNRKIVKTVPVEHILNLVSKLYPVRTQYDLIKVGSTGDGAYLIPDDLEGICACVSPGISNIVNFELDMASRGIKSFMLDASVDSPPIDNYFFDFEKLFLGSITEKNFISLVDFLHLKNLYDNKNLLLQMDIEGSEWDVLLDISSEELAKFRIMIIEFHGLDCLVESRFFPVAKYIFNKILKEFVVVHAHPNNNDEVITYKNFKIPPTIEYTFLRKDRAEIKGFVKEFPHPMDIINEADKKNIVLPEGWHA